VIVVDDGSPISAQSEAEGLDVKPPFHLTIIPQQNGGVAAARNRGLQSVDVDTTYVAFLDSDDSWYEGHLEQGVTALERGHDFYFCDNKRDGHHDSYFAFCSSLLTQKIRNAAADAPIPLNSEETSTAILLDFATQASTTLYRYTAARDLLFDTSMKNAGEDTVFFMQLAGRMHRICFSPKVMVTCGEGINMYFSNLVWDSEGFFKCLLDGLRARLLIKAKVKLSCDNMRWNNMCIAKFRRDLVFHVLRYCVRNKGNLPPEAKALAREEKWVYVWFPFYAVQVSIGRALGLYHPS
jgi:succinoglycan biosynthesis protein ExoW